MISRPSPAKTRRIGMGHFFFVLSLATVLGSIALVWIGWEFYRGEFPDVTVLRTQYPVVHYHGRDIPPTVTLQRLRPSTWVSASDVAKPALGAVVVSEDWAFYQHKGYDPNQIKEAIKDDWEAGHFVRGASTITQQVARNVFLTKDKNLWRKLKELFLAVRLEDTVGKRKILETYLNVAEWGEGIFGIGAAARFYFHKSPSELTPKEGAFLAMLLPSPKRYAVSFRAKKLTDYAKDTVDEILSKMEQARYLSEDEFNHEISLPLSFEAVTAPTGMSALSPNGI